MSEALLVRRERKDPFIEAFREAPADDAVADSPGDGAAEATQHRRKRETPWENAAEDRQFGATREVHARFSVTGFNVTFGSFGSSSTIPLYTVHTIRPEDAKTSNTTMFGETEGFSAEEASSIKRA